MHQYQFLSQLAAANQAHRNSALQAIAKMLLRVRLLSQLAAVQKATATRRKVHRAHQAQLSNK